MIRCPPRPCALAGALLGLLALPLPAAAQLRSMTVPADVAVAVAPRGQAAPRLAAPASTPMEDAGAPVILPPGQGLMGAPLLGALLPAAAGALLGSSLAGGGGGGSGPVRTR
ncbi:hypothetical protein [Roseomonas marmotae]|uniref:Uncharacterized protein n=1 Tax=Roseomonas marmotae TaxID=2768161 RepID=A0ABS3KG39_9PROT|nr:hypothetical protein [Roseomonas marmotae]MBO1076392.1 hypothetical protein [Roseomonas marmotae]QTI79400.1 hypothetical protein IAI58_00780 [Roseomonas marmotae]